MQKAKMGPAQRPGGAVGNEAAWSFLNSVGLGHIHQVLIYLARPGVNGDWGWYGAVQWSSVVWLGTPLK